MAEVTYCTSYHRGNRVDFLSAVLRFFIDAEGLDP